MKSPSIQEQWSYKMKPYYQDKWVTIYHADCRELLPSLSDISAIASEAL